MQAVITSTPANVYMFEEGDLKWRGIVRVPDRQFTFDDLVRQANTGSQSYVSGVIQVAPDGLSLSLSFPTTGTFQTLPSIA